MLKPFVLIGLGGSGGKTLRYLHREMERRLRSTGWDRPIPGAWAFLHIDVPCDPDGYENDVPPGTLAGAKHYVKLTVRNRDYEFHDQSLMAHKQLVRAVHGWRPDPSADFAEIWKGAKQARAVGRVVTLTELGGVKARVEEAHNEVLSPESEHELREYADLIGAECSPSEVQFVLVGSLGGGAGSGMVVDIIEMVQIMAQPANPISMLYSPEIFDHLDAEHRPGIAANSLAALSELVSAFEHTGPVDPLEEGLISQAGISAAGSGRRVTLQNMLIGARNDHLRLPDSYAVFRSTGRALAAFIMNPGIAAPFSSYLTANMNHTLSLYERRAASNDPAPKAIFSSFGYATVGLGRSLYVDYASQRLAAASLMRLRKGHLVDPFSRALVDEDRLVRELVARQRLQFLQDCGLSETERNHNQVVDALRDLEAVKSETNRFRMSTETTFVNKFDEDRADMQGGKITQWWQPLEIKHRADAVAALYRQASVWSSTIQVRVLDAVAEAIGRFGLRVATGLVEEALAETKAAAAEFRKAATREDEGVRSKIANAGDTLARYGRKVVGPNHGAVQDVFGALAAALDHKLEAATSRLTASLLEDIGPGLLKPVLTALDQATRDLDAVLSKSGAGVDAAIVASWPSELRPAVPSTLLPAPNDILLVGIERFPQEFANVLRAQFDLIDRYDDETRSLENVQQAVDGAVIEVLSGRWFRSDDPSLVRPPQNLLTRVRNWTPNVDELIASGDAPQPAAVAMDLRPIERLLPQARAWVTAARGAVSEYANESLSDHLSPAHPSHIRRGETFVARLEQAVALSEPLLSVDDTAWVRAYAGADPDALTRIISPVPVDRGHEVYDEVADVLRKGLDTDPTAFFSETSKAAEIEIASFLSASIGPLPIDSLAKAIVADWNSCAQSAEKRAQFWRFRRTRRLPSFIPMSPARQAAFLRGWYTGLVLGQIPGYDVFWDERPLDVWRPSGRLTFPRYLLGATPVHELEVPLSVLQTMPLAMMTFSQGHQEDLEAYERVIELGSSEVPNPSTTYSTLSRPLQRWVDAGQPEPGTSGRPDAPVPDAALAGSATDTPDARIAAVRATLGEWKRTVDDVHQLDWETASSPTYAMPQLWEMAAEVSNALGAVDRALVDRHPSGPRRAGRPDPTAN